jgi:predicted nuclease with TOPRIM domain
MKLTNEFDIDWDSITVDSIDSTMIQLKYIQECEYLVSRYNKLQDSLQSVKEENGNVTYFRYVNIQENENIKHEMKEILDKLKIRYSNTIKSIKNINKANTSSNSNSSSISYK